MLQLPFHKKIKLILGAALTSQKGWFSTNENWLDISSETHWKRLFRGKVIIEAAVAEHVFEHLSEQQMRIALKLIYRHLLPGASLRIAVPDGNNPDPIYRQNTGINGIGADAKDHKQFLTYELLSSILKEVGFDCILREGYKINGELVTSNIDKSLGYIKRSRSVNSDASIVKYGWSFPDANTSLIVDAFK